MPKLQHANKTEKIIRDIENLFGDIYAADEVEVWLSTPQAALDGARPVDLIRAGESGAVIRAVNEILDGILH